MFLSASNRFYYTKFLSFFLSGVCDLTSYIFCIIIIRYELFLFFKFVLNYLLCFCFKYYCLFVYVVVVVSLYYNKIMIHNQLLGSSNYSAATRLGIFHWTPLIDFNFAGVLGGAGWWSNTILNLSGHCHESLLNIGGAFG